MQAVVFEFSVHISMHGCAHLHIGFLLMWMFERAWIPPERWGNFCLFLWESTLSSLHPAVIVSCASCWLQSKIDEFTI